MTAEQSAKKTWRQRFAGVLVWPSLCLSAFGLMSAFDDLIPNILRLSFLFRVLATSYRMAREWLYDQVQWLFSWIHITIPEIPDLAKDIIIIVGFFLAALNLESFRKFGESLLSALFERVWRKIMAVFVGYGPEPERTSLVFTYAPEVTWERWVSHAGRLLLAIFFAWLAMPVMPWGGLADQPYEVRLGIATVVSLIVVEIASRWASPIARAWTYPPRSVTEFIARIVVYVTTFPGHILRLFLTGMIKARMALLIGAVIVAVLVGLNYLFLHILEPAMERPPQWLCAMVEANPDAEARARCGIE